MDVLTWGRFEMGTFGLSSGPPLSYGLEVLDLKVDDIKSLEKNTNSYSPLPDRVQNSIALALLGILPVEAVLHKNMLNLFGRLINTAPCNENFIRTFVA